MKRLVSITAVAALVTFLHARPAAAEVAWELIYTREIDVSLCRGCGIMLAGTDFALVVNTGTEDIVGSQFFGATLTATSSSAGIRLRPFINEHYTSFVAIRPDEVFGSVMESTHPDFSSNGVLLTLLEPGEVHQNPRAQVIAFGIERTESPLPLLGSVHIDFTMTMAGRVARFRMDAQVRTGEFGLEFSRAARIRSVPLSTPAESKSWGRLKAQYR